MFVSWIVLACMYSLLEMLSLGRFHALVGCLPEKKNSLLLETIPEPVLWWCSAPALCASRQLARISLPMFVAGTAVLLAGGRG
jgi:hypothetical protein